MSYELWASDMRLKKPKDFYLYRQPSDSENSQNCFTSKLMVVCLNVITNLTEVNIQIGSMLSFIVMTMLWLYCLENFMYCLKFRLKFAEVVVQTERLSIGPLSKYNPYYRVTILKIISNMKSMPVLRNQLKGKFFNQRIWTAIIM